VCPAVKTKNGGDIHVMLTPFRKLAISYDRLPQIRKGGCLLAYSMINFRVFFNTS
jgi:hypothetical protein